MFGRTGQMFPRQRAYHDAIYQEDYVVEGSEECCRSRGLSAVLCWFLSVVILIGLAASVILTVFFILKSRSFVGKSSNGEDLDLLYTFNNGPENDIIDHESSMEQSVSVSVPPTSISTTLYSTSSSKGADIRPKSDFAFTSPPLKPETDNGLDDDSDVPSPNTSTKRFYMSPPTKSTTASTMTTTTEVPAFQPTKSSAVSSIFDKLKKFNENFPKSSSWEIPDEKPSLEMSSSESPDKSSLSSTSKSFSFTTTSRQPRPSTEPSPPILLFTMAPEKPIYYNRRTTRLPRIKTGHNFPSSTEYSDLTSSERTLFQIKSHVSPTVEMHLAGGHSVSIETEYMALPTPTPTPPAGDSRDVLYRIIKNLAPKFKNKTSPSANPNILSRTHSSTNPQTTATTTSTTATTVTMTTTTEEPIGLNLFQDDHLNEYPDSGSVRIVPAPNFTASYDTVNGNGDDHFSTTIDTETGNHFLDVLVGSEDHKTLITKETEAGIITSAILPPWFEGDGNDTGSVGNVLEPNLNSTTTEDGNSTSTVTIPTDFNSSHPNPSGSASFPSRITADIGNLFFNWFSNSPLPYNKTQIMDQSEKIPGRIKFEPIPANEPPKPPTSSWRELLKGLSPIFPVPRGPPPPKLIPEPAKNAFHFGTTDGTSDIYGYYSEDPSMAMNGHGQGHRYGLGQPMQMDERSDEDPMEPSPSHVIDIAYDPKQTPEIIIEPNEARRDENYDGDYQDALPSASEVAAQVVVPPPASVPQSPPPPHPPTPVPPTNSEEIRAPLGAGIRRPMESMESFSPDQLAPMTSAVQALEANLNMTASSEQVNNTLTIPEVTGNSPTNSSSSSEEAHRPSVAAPPYDNDNGQEVDDDSSPDQSSVDADTDNGLHQRKPVRGLDVNLFPSHRPEPSRVFEVYPTNYSRPSYSDPDLNSEESVQLTSAEAPPTSTNNSNSHVDLGFVPPKPVSFHSDSYSFSPSISTGGFQPLPNPDNWRPVVYGDGHGREREGLTAAHPAAGSRYSSESSYEPPSHRDRIVHPLYVPPFSPVPRVPTPPTPSLVVLSTPNSAEEAEDRNVHVWMSTTSTQEPVALTVGPTKPSLPIKPSQKIPQGFGQAHAHAPNKMNFIQPSASMLQNSIIDRSKYAYRPPVTPPVVMRRTPQHNMPFLPQRAAMPNPNQIRKNSQGGGGGRGEFPRAPPQFLANQFKQQQRLKQHLFEQHMRGNGRPGPGPPNDGRIQQQQFAHMHMNQNRRVG